MPTKTDIANLALTMLGTARVTSIDPPDDTEDARLIYSLWDILRDEEQRARAWNFCLSRATLAADVATPAFEYDFQFTLPSDCLRVLQAGEQMPGISFTNYRTIREQDWSIEQNKLLTDLAAPLSIRYVARITDVSKWDACFAQVFACRLAVTCCERINYSASKRQMAEQEYAVAFKRARRANAIEIPPIPLPDNTPVLARM